MGNVACKRGIWVCGLLIIFALITLAPGSAQAVITEIIDSSGDGAGNNLDKGEHVAVDGAGNVYITGGTSNNAFKITPEGVITEIIDGFGDVGGNSLVNPEGIAVDGAGNVYVAGTTTDNVFKIATPGTCSTGGTPCTITEIIEASGDGGNSLDKPNGIAVDGTGNVYVAGTFSDNVFKIATPGTCSTGGTPCTITEIIDAAGDGSGNTFNEPLGSVAVDGAGNVFVSGVVTDNAFKIATPGTCSTGGTPCTITEIIDGVGAGGGNILNAPGDVAVDGSGNVYVAALDSDNAFKIATPGTCSTSGTPCTINEIIDASGDGGGNSLTDPRGIAVDDGSGDVYVTGGTSDNAFKITPPAPDVSVTKIDSSDPVVIGDSFTYTITVTNNDDLLDATNVVLTDTLPAGVSLVSTAGGCAEDPAGVPTCTLDTINASASVVVTMVVDADTSGLATNSASVSADGTDPNPANDTAIETTLLITPACVSTEIIDRGAGIGILDGAFGIAVDGSGNVDVAGTISDNAFKITPGGVITEIIDNTGDGGGNTLSLPFGNIAVDGSGNVYVTGSGSDNAFKITPGGVITEIIDSAGAGGGKTLSNPEGIAVDGSGNVYVTGSGSNNAFKITPGGVITEIIDSAGAGGGKTLSNPEGIAVDGSGNVYVAGSGSNNAFKITPGGVITEIIDSAGAGGGNILGGAFAIAVDGSENVYVAGTISDNAFKITPGGVITEIIDSAGAGGGNILDSAFAIAVDGSENVYVAGSGSDNAFKITPGGVITEIINAAGDGGGNILNLTRGIAVDGSGNVYVTGQLSNNAFKITCAAPDLSVTKIDSSDPVVVGDSFTYTITVTNNDIFFDATNVVLTDTLPAGVSLLSTNGCAEDPNGAPTCTLGVPLTAGASAVVTMVVDADLDGLATNSASVSADETDPNPANDTAIETTLLIDQTSTSSFTGTAEGGSIDFKVNGVSLEVTTTAGQSAAEVAAAMAAAINADPTLTTAGVGAVAEGNSVITNGVITDIVINDAGLTQAVIPALSGEGLLAFLLLLLAGGAALRWRRRRAA